MNLVYSIQMDVSSISKSQIYQIYLIFLLLMGISYMISKTKIITEFLTDNLEEDNQLLFIYQ